MTLVDPRLAPPPGVHRSAPSPTVPGHGPVRRTAWFGVVAIGAVVTWLGVVGVQALSGAHDLISALATAQGRTVGPALVAVVVLVALAERRWPAVDRPWLARGHRVDAAYFALFAVVVVPVLTLVETGFAVELTRHAHFLLVGRLPLGPQVVVVGLTLVGIDAMNWLAHLANHRSASLWRLHALHHSQEDMSVLTTFRTHPLVHATYLGALLPALILGASGTVPATAIIVYGCLVTVPHANLRWTFGPLGRVLVSPAYHRLHHARLPVDDRGTVNFGFVLVGWDQVARLAQFPTGGTPVATGLAGRPVPVEQSADAGRLDHLVVNQLTQPFRRRTSLDGPL